MSTINKHSLGVYKIFTEETRTKHREKLINTNKVRIYWDFINGSMSEEKI